MRIKRGVTKRAKHKKILDLAKGYRMSHSKTYRRAKQAVLHAGQYSYVHRRQKPAQLREEWIKIISSYLSNKGIAYSRFINQLKKNKIEIDRKNLAELILYSTNTVDLLLDNLEK